MFKHTNKIDKSLASLNKGEKKIKILVYKILVKRKDIVTDTVVIKKLRNYYYKFFHVIGKLR